MEPLVWNWIAGEDEFLLRIGELEALDDSSSAGVLDLRYRLMQGYQRGGFEHSPVKIREVMDCIRLGLIGAGADRKEADRKVKSAFVDADIASLCLLAFTLISHSLKGKEHDPVGETEAAENPDA